MILCSECTDCSNEHPEQSKSTTNQTNYSLYNKQRIVCSVVLSGTEQPEQSSKPPFTRKKYILQDIGFQPCFEQSLKLKNGAKK